jgi:hypothetical protein
LNISNIYLKKKERDKRPGWDQFAVDKEFEKAPKVVLEFAIYRWEKFVDKDNFAPFKKVDCLTNRTSRPDHASIQFRKLHYRRVVLGRRFSSAVGGV